MKWDNWTVWCSPLELVVYSHLVQWKGLMSVCVMQCSRMCDSDLKTFSQRLHEYTDRDDMVGVLYTIPLNSFNSCSITWILNMLSTWRNTGQFPAQYMNTIYTDKYSFIFFSIFQHSSSLNKNCTWFFSSSLPNCPMDLIWTKSHNYRAVILVTTYGTNWFV